MSRKSRTLRKTLAGGPGDQPPITRMRGPGDVAAMVPYLLGFRPSESLVLVALTGPRKRFGPVLRVDLIADPSLREEQAELVVSAMTTNRVTRVVVVAFSVEAESADAMVRRVMTLLAERQVEVEDAFRADGRRWWSYVCHNPRCCSPNGVPYDAGASRVVAEAVVAGLTCAPDRDSLRAELAPDDASRRDSVRGAVLAARRAGGDGRPTADRVGAAVRDALAAVVGDSDLSADQVARLALVVQSPLGAERAARCITRPGAADHYELWRRVARRVDDDLLPSVGCLAALSAWLDGRGVLAWHAVERVLEVAPSHPFAEIIAGLLHRAVNPALWFDALARLPDVDDGDGRG